MFFGDLWQYGERCIADKTAGNARESFVVDWESKSTVGLHVRGMRMRSVNEYMAQTFGAQYAWHKPLENGNNRSFS